MGYELDAELSFGRRIGECVAEGGAGGDAEFGEDLVQVGGYRSRGEEEPGGDLFVGVACRGEQGDLALLRREGGRAGAGRGDGDTGGSPFTVRAGRPGDGPESAEDFRGGGQLAAGVGGALDAAQVGAVDELDAGQVEGPAVVARLGDRQFESGGLGAAAGVDGGFDEIEEDPQGVRGVGRQGARRAASSACTRRRCSLVDSSTIAERMSGWRKVRRAVDSSARASPARSADSRPCPARSAASARIRRRSPVPSRTARSSSS